MRSKSLNPILLIGIGVLVGAGCTTNMALVIAARQNTANEIKGTSLEKAADKGLINRETLINAKAFGVFHPARSTEDFPILWGEEQSGQAIGQSGGASQQTVVIPSYVRKQGQKVIVAVFNIQDATGEFEPKLLDQLTDYYCGMLTQSLGFKVVPRDQIKKRLSQQKKESYQACYDQSCQIEIGKASAAQKSIATKLIKIGDRCTLVSTMYDLKTQTSEKAANAITDCTPDSLMNGIIQLIKKFSEQK